MGLTFARTSDVKSREMMPVALNAVRDIVFVCVEKKICGLYERR